MKNDSKKLVEFPQSWNVKCEVDPSLNHLVDNDPVFLKKLESVNNLLASRGFTPENFEERLYGGSKNKEK